MSTNLTGLALALSIGALAVAGYTMLQERPAPADLGQRLDDLDERLARIEKSVTAREARIEDGPSLAVRESRPQEPVSLPLAGTFEARSADPSGSDPAPLGAAEPEEAEEKAAKLAALVDEAVEKKAAQLQVMRNKKPSIDVFAKTLELTDLQRQAVEQEVVRSQHEIKAILEMPAADGTNFLDELVEVMAHGMANPGQNKGRGLKLFGRLMSETVPGTDETYAARIEGVKNSLRDNFKRNWTPKQYATLETWQMDPTEVQGIEGSPWKELEGRLIERAKELGAHIPDKDEGPR